MPLIARQALGLPIVLLGLLFSACHVGSVFADDFAERSRLALREAASRSAALPRPALLPRAAFLRPAVISEVLMAPDGRHIVYQERGDQQSRLMLMEIATGRARPVLKEVRSLETAWSGDGRRLWLADEQGLAVLELAQGRLKRLLRWDPTRHQRFWKVDARAVEYALISEKLGRDGAWRYRYLRVDAAGRSILLHESARALHDAFLAPDGSLAFSAGYAGADFDTLIRRHEPAGTQELLRCTGIARCRLAGWDGRASMPTLLAHDGEDRMSLRHWLGGRWQTLHRDPDRIADAAELLWADGGRDWIGVAYHPDRRRWYGRDAAAQARLDGLQRRLPEANLHLSATADGRLWLVQARRAAWREDRYFLYRPETEALSPLFGQDSEVAALAPAQPLAWQARDGLLIHGYVYLPQGVTMAKAPLVALIHGGPFGRVRDDYDGLAQLLANRGYVVFAPNFRASTGYGLSYLRASQGDFGKGKVLADILDGLDYLLAQGIGDKERQAVVGHSFGGYASLLAVSHVPQRFQFAVASAAPVDFRWVIDWIADNGGSALPEDGPPAELYFQQHGLPVASADWRERMRRDAPLARLNELRVPIYLWAGATDDRVPLKSLVHYAGEARRQGKALSLLIDPESGHNPQQPLHREAIGYLYEAAAHRHFGGGLTPASAELQAFLDRNLRLEP